MFFYNVSEEKPLILEYDKTKFKFTDVLFEFKNTVIEGRSPSNVDIVLLGKNKNDNKSVMLFLESKFLEYCGDVKEEIKIAKSYSVDNLGKQIYNEKNIREIFNNNIDSVKINDIYIKLKKECYIEGIKQMISHYIGISNLLTNKNMQKLYVFLVGKSMFDNTEIYLGEILFDFHNMNIDDKEDDKKDLKNGLKEEFEKYFDNYSGKYENLVEVLKGIEKKKDGNKINLFPNLLTYSLFNRKPNKEDENVYKIIHEVSPEIKEYYKLK